MTLVLDAGAVTALAGDKERLAAIARRGVWPPKVPSVVLSECLTGDQREDRAVNRLLRTCTVVPVEESLAREAARLRSGSRRSRRVSAVAAVVAALAAGEPRATVLTADPAGLRSLTQRSDAAVSVVRI